MSEIKMTYSINEFCAIFGISRSTFYGLVKTGGVRPGKILGKTVVTRSEIDRFASSLEKTEAAE